MSPLRCLLRAGSLENLLLVSWADSGEHRLSRSSPRRAPGVHLPTRPGTAPTPTPGGAPRTPRSSAPSGGARPRGPRYSQASGEGPPVLCPAVPTRPVPGRPRRWPFCMRAVYRRSSPRPSARAPLSQRAGGQRAPPHRGGRRLPFRCRREQGDKRLFRGPHPAIFFLSAMLKPSGPLKAPRFCKFARLKVRTVYLGLTKCFQARS